MKNHYNESSITNWINRRSESWEGGGRGIYPPDHSYTTKIEKTEYIHKLLWQDTITWISSLWIHFVIQVRQQGNGISKWKRGIRGCTTTRVYHHKGVPPQGCTITRVYHHKGVPPQGCKQIRTTSWFGRTHLQGNVHFFSSVADWGRTLFFVLDCIMHHRLVIYG